MIAIIPIGQQFTEWLCLAGRHAVYDGYELAETSDSLVRRDTASILNWSDFNKNVRIAMPKRWRFPNHHE